MRSTGLSIRLAALAPLVVSILLGCGKEGPSDVDLTSTLPATPADLIAVVGETQVELRWEVPDTTGIGSYRIFRGTSADRLTLASTTAESRYLDANLVSGRRYFYQIAAVSRSGVEGRRSDTAVVTPNVFAVEIQGGDEATNARRVTLELSAPGGTAWMILANDTLFTGAAFQSLSILKDWTLTEGDGAKRVFARFRDTLGVESAVRWDDILLDTRAEIRSFEVREGVSGAAISSAKAYTPGDTLFLSLRTDETGGTAFAAIGSAVPNLVLTDDGQGGDRVAGNGSYELRYVLPTGLAVEAAAITGDFTDRAGNDAPSATALGSLTVVATREPPPAVTLNPVAPIGATEATLTWTASDAVDFASYRVYRSIAPNVTETDVLVGQPVTSRSATLLVDSGLAENTPYFWRVFVRDADGLATPSNEVTATTTNTAPPAVTLASATADSESVLLRWTSSSAADFEAYRLRRSLAEAVSESSATIVIVTERSETTFVDTSVVEGETYFYRLYVVDRGDLTAGSNKRSATISNVTPPSVVLSAPSLSPGGAFPVPPQNVTLNWTTSTIPDFSRYEVFTALGSSGACAGSPVGVLRDPDLSSFVVAATLPGTHFFSVRIVDRGGLSACSNVVVAVVEQDTTFASP